MSGSAGGLGGSPTGNAGSTFISPSTATTGLQRYNLQKPIVNLNQSSLATARKRLRALAGRRDQRRHASARKSANSDTLQKDTTMLIQDTISKMVGALSESVAGIQAAGGANASEALKKSFDEFTAALTAEIDGDLAKRAPIEEPLFKGLGTIGRVAEMLGHVSKKIEAMKAGYDNEWQMNSAGPNSSTPNDPASDDVADLLENGMHMIELALRAAVNEHVQLADDDDMAPGATLPAGMHLIMVPDGDDPSTGAVVKTTLPEDLAKFATDPAVLQNEIIESGLSMMVMGGVEESQLEKMLGVFEGEDVLGKAFPPKKKTDGSDGSDPNAAPNPDPNPNPVPATNGEGSADPGVDPDPNAGGDMGLDDQNPLEVLMRMLSGCMVIVHDLDQAISGTGDGTDPNAATDPSGSVDPNMGKRAPRALTFAAAPQPAPTAAAPSAEVLELRKMVADLVKTSAQQGEALDLVSKGMAIVLNAPVPAKGVVGPVGALQLSKAADGAGGVMTAEQLNEELNKLSPEQRALQLIKMSQQMPEPRFRS